MLEMWIARKPAEVFGFSRKILVADGTRIQEQGPTGSGWMLHDAIELLDLKCEQALVKDWANSGEGFGRFEIQSGELWIGDRAYGKRPGIAHKVAAGADVIARFAFNNLPLFHLGGASFDSLAHLRTLGDLQAGDWPVELVFKRLKSILGFGHLPKCDKQSIRSWLERKLLVALLLEALLVKGESFFPWGYPLQATKGA